MIKIKHNLDINILKDLTYKAMNCQTCAKYTAFPHIWCSRFYIKPNSKNNCKTLSYEFLNMINLKILYNGIFCDWGCLYKYNTSFSSSMCKLFKVDLIGVDRTKRCKHCIDLFKGCYL